MNEEILIIEEFDDLIKKNESVIFYFSTPNCNVCKVIKPKLMELINKKFPNIKFIYINTESAVELAAQKGIFTVPTIIVYFEGKEFLRKSRHINISELKEEIERLYNILHNR